MRRKRKVIPRLLRAIVFPAIAVAALLCFNLGLSNLNRDGNSENMRLLEDAVRRSCVACYASEGVYPPSLDYLKQRYGLQIDEKRYTVRYHAFAENLMPDITVLENTP